jgi:large subunit ribosomal protein L31
VKTEIHPEYGPSVITCACGNKVQTGSTKPEMSPNICAACHPFYTGTQKVNTGGRIDRFKKRIQATQNL